MYILNIARAVKKCQSLNSNTLSLKIIWKLGFLKKTVLFNENFKKKNFIVAFKRINRKKAPDPHKAKEHYQSFIRKKNLKS